jgi:hypothetical protein
MLNAYQVKDKKQVQFAFYLKQEALICNPPQKLDMISRFHTFTGRWPDYKEVTERMLSRGL